MVIIRKARPRIEFCRIMQLANIGPRDVPKTSSSKVPGMSPKDPI